MKTEVSSISFLSIKYSKYGLDEMFMKTLKERINTYFARNNISKYGNKMLVIKIMLVLFIFFGSYGLLISNKFSGSIVFLLGTICGLSHILIVMNIGHDAAHNALSSNTRLNKFLSWSIELSGMSHFMWKINHNIIHHPYPNITPVDSELNMALPFLRLSTLIPKKTYHIYQHIYAPFIYLFFTINLIFIRDFQDSGIFPKETSQRAIKKFPASHYVILFLSKIFYITYALILPIIFLSIVWWKILLGFLFIHFIMSAAEMCIQLPLHINEHSNVVKVGENGVIQNNWPIQTLQSTTDYLSKSKVANFITGGINTHTIHHFFPGICHIHYVHLTQILAETSKEFGLPYQCRPWAKSFLSHFKQLKQLAIEP